MRGFGLLMILAGIGLALSGIVQTVLDAIDAVANLIIMFLAFDKVAFVIARAKVPPLDSVTCS